MTAEVASDRSQAGHELVRSLARLPTSDLVRFTLQKPDVARVFASSLNSLALQVVSSPLPPLLNDQLAKSHVEILARLIERGDPSLARKFVPTQGSLVDLAVATPPEAKSIVASVLERLLDATSAKEIIGGLSAQLKNVSSSEGQHDFTSISPIVRTLARLSSAFLSACPPRLVKGNASILQTWTQTCFQLYDKVLPQIAKDLAGDAAGTALEPDLTKLDAESWQLSWLTCRVDLLQLLSILLDQLKGSPLFIASLRDSLIGTEKLLKKGGFSTLLNSTALLDLAATSDSWPTLRSEMLSNSAFKKNNAGDILSSIDTLATSVPKFTGAAWDALQRFVSLQTSTPASEAKNLQSSSSSPVVSEEVLASVDSILPHYGVDRLRTILARPSFMGQNAEMVIQRLLEGDEGESDAAASASSRQSAAVVSRLPAPRPQPQYQLPIAEAQTSASAAPSLVKSRANVFGEFAFDPSTIVQPKISRSGRVDELAPELKAAILARAEAADGDEGEEEWNPFAEPQRTVGVEDELDLDYDGRERNTVPRRTHDDDDDDEALDEDDAGRSRERLLLRHYVQQGSHSFSSDAGTRRSEARQKLKQQTGWSDDLIESWAVMLDRNPRKDRLLAAASQSELDEQLASRDQSRNTSDVEDDAPKRWGPDRGRGGRILGGGRRGRGGGGGGRGGGNHAGGSSGGGGHQTKNATRGRGTGNSGTDRSAKQKEKAGNKARQKGHDKKMARVNP
ncbi:uncharacterized protein UTRI_02871 [Ustilago trichophora]|uniref:CUE domain-containing protein n=1 Tax=Ustilago trichophora TaxID=86804 RepID=A0A5C3ENU2_9BASI|nr:uncharacterized protein UTRI_02871 [Ustilago trichophora]